VKKFHFSLQKLLKYKEQLFEAEQIILRDMRNLLSKMESDLEEMLAQRELRSEEFRGAVAGGMFIYEIQLHQVFLRQLDHDIEQKRKQIQFQTRAVDKQIDKVRNARQEIITIEKLKEKKLEEYHYAEQKENELFIEEYVSTQRAMGSGIER